MKEFGILHREWRACHKSSCSCRYTRPHMQWISSPSHQALKNWLLCFVKLHTSRDYLAENLHLTSLSSWQKSSSVLSHPQPLVCQVTSAHQRNRTVQTTLGQEFPDKSVTQKQRFLSLMLQFAEGEKKILSLLLQTQ